MFNPPPAHGIPDSPGEPRKLERRFCRARGLDGSAHSLLPQHEAAPADLGEKQELHRTDHASNQDAHDRALTDEPRIENKFPAATSAST